MSTLNNTGVADLRSSLKCAAANNRTLPLADLRAALEDERQSPPGSCRLTMVRLLEREIRRQERLS